MKNNIALMSDWGVSDGAVGSVKGVIFGINPDANIIDMSHDVGSWDIRQGAFLLMAHYRTYPKGTIFVVVIDPGVGTKRKAILVETDNYYFLGPDNGVLSWALRKELIIMRVIDLTNEQFFRRPISSTFHGRDIFAAVAAHLSKGVLITDFGEEIAPRIEPRPIEYLVPDIVWTPYPLKVKENQLIGEILFIDKFGNLITSIPQGEFSTSIGNGDFQICIGNNPVRKLSMKLSHTYADGKKSGEVLAFFGGDFRSGISDLLDIAAYKASAAETLGAKVGDKIIIERR